jgi:hypothetical protein
MPPTAMRRSRHGQALAWQAACAAPHRRWSHIDYRRSAHRVGTPKSSINEAPELNDVCCHVPAATFVCHFQATPPGQGALVGGTRFGFAAAGTATARDLLDVSEKPIGPQRIYLFNSASFGTGPVELPVAISALRAVVTAVVVAGQPGGLLRRLSTCAATGAEATDEGF